MTCVRIAIRKRTDFNENEIGNKTSESKMDCCSRV